jgi:hypothetical protein
VTVSVAAALVTLPLLFVAVTVYEPAEALAIFESVSVELVAPAMALPPKLH